jgi:hypothetical protein
MSTVCAGFNGSLIIFTNLQGIPEGDASGVMALLPINNSTFCWSEYCNYPSDSRDGDVLGGNLYESLERGRPPYVTSRPSLHLQIT